MPTTTYLGLTYPSLSSAPNVPQDMQTLAGNVDTKVSGVILCTSGTRPTSREGATIYETDTDRYATYNGSAWIYVGGTRITSFVPTLTASSSNPTMGTGAVRLSWYTYLPGPSIQYMFIVKFGTSGAAAGSGSYSISLPVTSNSALGSSVHSALGTIMIADASSGALRTGNVFISGTDLGNCTFVSEGGVPVTAAAPWAWANSDYISGSIVYPI